MSRASYYMERWNDADKLQPMVSYDKSEGKAGTGFNAALTGDGFIIISQQGQEQKSGIIKMDLEGSKKFVEWIWRICKED